MNKVRNVVKVVGALGGLAAVWFAGAAPIWQGFGHRLHP